MDWKRGRKGWYPLLKLNLKIFKANSCAFFIFLLSLRIYAGVAWIYFSQQKDFTDIPHAIARHSQTRQQTILTFNPLVAALIINQRLNVVLEYGLWWVWQALSSLTCNGTMNPICAKGNLPQRLTSIKCRNRSPLQIKGSDSCARAQQVRLVVRLQGYPLALHCMNPLS